MAESTLTITDNRSGQTIEVPVDEHGAVSAAELKKLGVVSYDQPLLNTAITRSAVTYIDGDAGILRYRGYPIEQLAELCSFEEVAFLLAEGELPTQKEAEAFARQVEKTPVNYSPLSHVVEAFPPGSHPMSILMAAFAALSAAHQEAKQVHDPEVRRSLLPQLMAEVALAGAWAINRGAGREHPCQVFSVEGSYAKRFLATVLGPDAPYLDVYSSALDVLFTLHADHEQNCSANAMRAIGSSDADPYSALAGATAALYGPLHGGANEAVLRMLAEIGDVSHVPAFMEGVKNKERKLMGFGHRVYKNYDPRAKVIKKVVDEVLAVAGDDPRLAIATELERIALSDDYFVSRKLYPNVDFYSGVVYSALGFDPAAFTVLFAVPRTVGWFCQWDEMMADPSLKIVRPAQVYVGEGERAVPAERA